MSGKVNKLLRKTAGVIKVPVARLKAGYRRQNRTERTITVKGLKEALGGKR